MVNFVYLSFCYCNLRQLVQKTSEIVKFNSKQKDGDTWYLHNNGFRYKWRRLGGSLIDYSFIVIAVD